MSVMILRRRKLGRTSCREIAALSKHDIQVVRNDKMPDKEFDTCIRWGCTSASGVKNVINSSEAIHQVNDKLAFRRVMNEHELCPTTYFDVAEAELGVLAGMTMVVRPDRHAQGRHLRVCRTLHELRRACALYPRYYISHLINKVAEYRVFVVSGRAVCVAKKTPGNPEDVAWNVAQGGRFDNVRWDDWPLAAVRVAIEAFNLTDLDFGGVDVMVDAQGKAYVLEINSAPSLTSPYRQACMAKGIDYILDHGKKRIPLIKERGGYKKFIHPAVCEEAKLVQE